MVVLYSLVAFTCGFWYTRADIRQVRVYIPALYVQTSGPAAGADVQVHGGTE